MAVSQNLGSCLLDIHNVVKITYVCICRLCCKYIICLSDFWIQAKMRKTKGKANTIEKEFVFEFRAGKHICVLKVPLHFPFKDNVSDLHGRIMLLHKIPCFVENGNVLTIIWETLFSSRKYELLCKPLMLLHWF